MPNMKSHVILQSYTAALGFVYTALSQRPTTFTPVDQKEVSFSIAIPNTTASSRSGPILFQIKAPSSLQWVGLGQGKQMAGANMFILYSAPSNNVTISPRSGQGHFPPVYNPNSRVFLLDGSGIHDGTMTANVLCENCIEWQGGSIDPSSSSTQWIYAYKEGPPLNSVNATESIQRHDGNGIANADLTQAKTTTDNPFLTYNPATGSNDAVSSMDGTRGNAMLVAHGLMMAITFVLLFPSFALLISLPWVTSPSKVHAPLQVLALTLAIAGMGVGIQLAIDKKVKSSSHPIIGIIVVALLVLFQPLMGFLQHRHFRRNGGKGAFAYLHRWLGRSMIILGIVNGGLGFRLAGIGNPSTPRSAMIAYSVIAGVMGLLYLGTHLLVAMQGRSRGQERKLEHNRHPEM
ncbi:cytochrome and DOMON domain-containing protein [Aspergillus alliaceus]|uniref:cytochrome and DOMON domain-containing protein n=1 Tax=Petromyces alliaceus TaxID=209559 RepID=UPI0012A673BF|nr:uncharacterized protein BDW43DRAFT_323509 [Aspergillus alliaceus]KAB8227804.1 hypothetical protein BDW43DRAFT_323509 [Aspergillus alliaceus]